MDQNIVALRWIIYTYYLSGEVNDRNHPSSRQFNIAMALNLFTVCSAWAVGWCEGLLKETVHTISNFSTELSRFWCLSDVYKWYYIGSMISQLSVYNKSRKNGFMQINIWFCFLCSWHVVSWMHNGWTFDRTSSIPRNWQYPCLLSLFLPREVLSGLVKKG